MNIGIDFGGVLSTTKNKEDIKNEHNNINIDIPNAIKSLIELKNKGHKLFLISYCGEQKAIETKESIIKNNLINVFDGLYFVKKRKYKADICKYLNCHFMIDDNKDILKNIKKDNTKIIPILFGKESAKFNYAFEWKDIIKIIELTQYSEINNNFNNIIDLCHNI